MVLGVLSGGSWWQHAEQVVAPWAGADPFHRAKPPRVPVRKRRRNQVNSPNRDHNTPAHPQQIRWCRKGTHWRQLSLRRTIFVDTAQVGKRSSTNSCPLHAVWAALRPPSQTIQPGVGWHLSSQEQASPFLKKSPEPYWAQYFLFCIMFLKMVLQFELYVSYAGPQISLHTQSARVPYYLGIGNFMMDEMCGATCWFRNEFGTVRLDSAHLFPGSAPLSPTAGVRILLHGQHVSTIKVVKQFFLPLMFADFVFFPSALL